MLVQNKVNKKPAKTNSSNNKPPREVFLQGQSGTHAVANTTVVQGARLHLELTTELGSMIHMLAVL